MSYASVIIPVALQGTFTYSVPVELEASVKPGSAVVVSFGKSKLYTGIVKEILQENLSGFQAKPLLSVSDVIVTVQQLWLWDWISNYYCCSLGEVMKAAVPQSLRPDSETRFFLDSGFDDSDILLSDKQRMVWNAINPKKASSLSEITATTGIKNPLPFLQQLLEAGYIATGQYFSGAYKASMKKFISLPFSSETEAHTALDALKRSPAQQEFLTYLIENSEGNFSDYSTELSKALQEAGASIQIANNLAKKGFVCIENRTVDRLVVSNASKGLKNLTAEQAACKNTIESEFAKHDVVLLHGITSSGKTEIYLSLIEKALNEGKTALYLLPEIAITTQIIRRIRDAFGPIAGIYHSKYSDAERAEVWNKVANGTYRVILGVRSSVFLPLQNPGIIIVDEEHENSYKQQDPAPRYHARDVAIVLAARHKAKLVLGTATPSLESFYNHISGKFGYAILNHRYGNVEMPEIIVVDTRDAAKRKIMQFHFHPLLVEEIRSALSKKEQVILFRNRRGYSPYIECSDCGFVIRCEFCNVSLTYHKQRKAMVCHYCANMVPLPGYCPECKSTKLKTMGYGTEMIEDEAAQFFPDAVISRLDLDTARTRGAYEKIISDFEQHHSDILIGTQMISKGLDFGNVAIVGILNADSMLNFPDFRAFERSYQLMTQVSGRAGRKHKRGKVIVQTSMIDHEIIHDVIRGDYENMAQRELEVRKQFRYPPFFRFMRIKMSHLQPDVLAQAAGFVAGKLSEILPGRIMGPEEPLVNKIQKQFIMYVVVRYEPSLAATKVKQGVQQVLEETEKHADFKGIRIILDVDPI